MRWRLAMLGAAALLVSGCWWEGPPFYKGDPADAAPIKAGLYKVDVLGDGEPAEKVRLVWLPNGSIDAIPLKPKKKDPATHFVMVRFAAAGRDLWITQMADSDDRESASYGLAELRGKTLWMAPVIDCDSTVAIVRAAGGEVPGGTVETDDTEVAPYPDPRPSSARPPPKNDGRATNQRCVFGDRASLERALRAYVAANPDFPMRVRFKRIGD